MLKQTKMIKVMLVVFMLIPIVLFSTGVIQTFVLKSKQAELLNAKNNQAKAQQEYNILNQKHSYVFNEDGTLSEEFLKEFFRHNGKYGDEGDVDIELK